MRALLLLAAVLALPAAAQPLDPEYGLIQQDQRTAEFAAGARRGDLEALHQQQLNEARGNPGQRARMARDRDALMLRMPPASAAAPRFYPPLPLPGGPAHAVDPIPALRVGS